MKLRLGTRRSPLARVQADLVAGLLIEGGLCAAVDIVALETTGDRVLDRPLRDVGGKGLFVKELDEALLDGRVDCAVHSLKDVPSELPEGIVIAAVPPRADERDMLISLAGWSIDTIPDGARLGTSSLRRSAQLAALRPNVDSVLLRGNVQTRLRRIENGDVDATFLASAGIARLGVDMEPAKAVILEPNVMVPAAGQGALAVTVRVADDAVRECVAVIDCAGSHRSVAAERGLAAVMGGGCHLPLGANAVLVDEGMVLTAVVCSPDGTRIVREKATGTIADPAAAEAFGAELGRRMLDNGADEILRELPS